MSINTHNRILAWILTAGLSTCLSASAATARHWSGSGDGWNWFNANNWNPAGIPAGGDSIFITNTTSIRLTNQTDWLAGLSLTNATITFTNWFSELRATNIVLRNNGKFALPGPFTTNTMPSNRILVACSNFTLEAGGMIDANWAGYAAAIGPGAGPTTSRRNGGGHGGKGGSGDLGIVGGQPYGSIDAPSTPGSGGCYTGNGGSGGGVVRIHASGTLTLHGIIQANGRTRTGSQGGGGAGGSIHLTCHTLAGNSSGLLQAKGGDGDSYGGGGGGGRIAVHYTLLSGSPANRFSTASGSSTFMVKPYDAGHGTLFLTDTRLLSGILADSQFDRVNLYFASANSWSTESLLVSNCTLRIAVPHFTVNVTNTLRISTAAEFGVCHLNVGGNVVLTNGGQLVLLSSPTNSPTPGYGSRLSVTGNVTIAPNSWILPYADPTNGATVLLVMSNLTIASGGGIDADAKGYQSARGPGAGIDGDRRTGAGYGGAGGYGTFGKLSSGPAGQPYGTPDNPRFPGSGGGKTGSGGYGGGAIRIQASGTMSLHGTLTANGNRGIGTSPVLPSGGSGGGILVECQTLAGHASGIIQANGGNGSGAHGGGGGGGRIAVLYNTLTNSTWPGIRFSTSPGTGYSHLPMNARQGTVYLPNTACLTQTLHSNLFTEVDLVIPGFTNWSVNHLSISNCSFRLTPSNFVLTVTNHLTIGPNGVLGATDILCGGNLTLSGGGKLHVYALPTNSTTRPGHGAQVTVGDTLTIRSGSWIYPWSDPLTGGSPLFQTANVFIDSGGGFDATARGYRGNQGAGTGGNGERIRGAGYGGRGAPGGLGGTLGLTYGFTNAPLHPGSGGAVTAAGEGGYGGGFIRIEATQGVTLNGSLIANGGNPLGYNTYPSAGSGGGIFIQCRQFTGEATASMQANGGNGYSVSGGGGGGRIAVWHSVDTLSRNALLQDADNPLVAPRKVTATTHDAYAGSIQVNGGTGNSLVASNGTWTFLTVPLPPGSLFMIQ